VYVFRDAGEDGESVTRRAIAGLPEFLRPGGRFYCLCQATDRKDAPLEQRVRSFLGDRAAEFDVLVVTIAETDPLASYTFGAARRRTSFAEVGDWFALFERLGVTRLVYGSVVIQRHSDDRPPITLRRQVGAPPVLAGGEDWLFRWQAHASSPGASAGLWAARPWSSAHGQIMITLRAKDGEPWSPVKATLSTDWPFSAVVESPPLGAALVSRCDGRTSVAEHLAFFRQSDGLAPEVSDGEFLDFVRALISAGVLGIDEFPLPPVPGAPDAA
jgi:hypothetical protein